MLYEVITTCSVPQLLGERGFDAVFVGAGAGAPSFLGIPRSNFYNKLEKYGIERGDFV